MAIRTALCAAAFSLCTAAVRGAEPGQKLWDFETTGIVTMQPAYDELTNTVRPAGGPQRLGGASARHASAVSRARCAAAATGAGQQTGQQCLHQHPARTDARARC